MEEGKALMMLAVRKSMPMSKGDMLLHFLRSNYAGGTAPAHDACL